MGTELLVVATIECLLRVNEAEPFHMLAGGQRIRSPEWSLTELDRTRDQGISTDGNGSAAPVRSFRLQRSAILSSVVC